MSSHRILLLLIFLFGLMFYALSSKISFISSDLLQFLFAWYDHARQSGFSFIKTTHSDYPPLYLYVLWALTHIPIDKLYAIKSVSIFFNFLTAFSVYKIILLKYGRVSIFPYLSLLIIILSPTMIFNSVQWGQNDSICTFFVIEAIYQMMKSDAKRNMVLSLLIYGMGISFKLQPVFLLPLFFITLISRKLSLYYLLLIPLIYGITIIPALMAGKDILSLIGLVKGYLQYTQLTLNAPNLYTWLPNWSALSWVGHVTTFLLVSVIVFVLLRNRNLILSQEMIVKLALFFSVLVPFIFPHMHERYFFIADVLSIIYAFYFPYYFFVPLLVNTASFYSYKPFLEGTTVNLSILAILNFIALLVISIDIIKNLKKKNLAI